MGALQQKAWFNYLQIALGLFFCKVSYNLFLIPNNIAAGGFTGIGQLVNHVTGFPVGVFALLLNIPLFAVSLKKLGLALWPALARRNDPSFRLD